MKRGLIVFTLLLLTLTIVVNAQEGTEENKLKNTISNQNINLKEFSDNNPWNDAITISPAWQILIGGFFGLNLHSESTEISVREVIVFFMVFIMFFVLILDILKISPLFKTKFFSGDLLQGISGESVAALIITIIVSITGAFINLKNLLISGIASLIVFLDWEWLNNMTNNRGFWSLFIGAIIFLIVLIIHEIISWSKPFIKKYSEISRSEAQGRMLKSKIEQTQA